MLFLHTFIKSRVTIQGCFIQKACYDANNKSGCQHYNYCSKVTMPFVWRIEEKTENWLFLMYSFNFKTPIIVPLLENLRKSTFQRFFFEQLTHRFITLKLQSNLPFPSLITMCAHHPEIVQGHNSTIAIENESLTRKSVTSSSHVYYVHSHWQQFFIFKVQLPFHSDTENALDRAWLRPKCSSLSRTCCYTLNSRQQQIYPVMILVLLN